MQQLDLKDLTWRQSTPILRPLLRILRHATLVSITVGALLTTYFMLKAPAPSAEALATPAPVTSPTPPTPPHESASEAALPEPVSPQSLQSAESSHRWITATVEPRDTLSEIFKRHGVKVEDAYAAAKLKEAAVLRKIRPGQEIRLVAGEDDFLAALRYPIDTFTTLRIVRENEQLRATVVTRTPEVRVRSSKAIIWSSLLGAADGIDLDFDTVYDFARLFGWQVDFNREIQPGDQFSVIFEELYLDGKKVGNGDILAAELITAKGRLRAIHHRDAQGHITHYAPNGDGIQRSFLRSPIKFGQVTSNFSHRRFHPILKKWRPHRGVDYGAPTGTPVLATGDGVVTLAGRKRGYGKTITIRHGFGYTTLYAHLSGYAKKVKSGARVKQGEVIGYVGSTGWSTGPHLHYEFRVNGVHRNPLTVTLPKSAPIDSEYRQEFLTQAAYWSAELDRIGATSLAEIDRVH